MPDFCMAPGCSNRGVPSGIQRHFHSVPKNERIQKMWLNNMKLKDPPRGPDGKLSKHCRVCSDHFTADSYKRDLQAELMGLTRPRKLKEDAVPTIFDFSGYSTATVNARPSAVLQQNGARKSAPTPTDSRKRRLEERENKKMRTEVCVKRMFFFSWSIHF